MSKARALRCVAARGKHVCRNEDASTPYSAPAGGSRRGNDGVLPGFRGPKHGRLDELGERLGRAELMSLRPFGATLSASLKDARIRKDGSRPKLAGWPYRVHHQSACGERGGAQAITYFDLSEPVHTLVQTRRGRFVFATKGILHEHDPTAVCRLEGELVEGVDEARIRQLCR